MSGNCSTPAGSPPPRRRGLSLPDGLPPAHSGSSPPSRSGRRGARRRRGPRNRSSDSTSISGSEVSLLPLAAPTFSSLIISPDATRLVFVGRCPAARRDCSRGQLEDAKVTELGGTQGASHPFFSPDGQWVAFWSRGKLAKVPVEGGAVVPLADLAVMAGGHWTDDGSLVVGTGMPGPVGLVRVSADGGAPSPMVKLAPGELFHTYPHVLPGGKAALVAIVADPPSLETTRIEIVSFVDGRRQDGRPRGNVSPVSAERTSDVRHARRDPRGAAGRRHRSDARSCRADRRRRGVRSGDGRRAVQRLARRHRRVPEEFWWDGLGRNAGALARCDRQAGAAARQGGSVLANPACHPTAGGSRSRCATAPIRTSGCSIREAEARRG